ncbi:MAG TPA: aminopeptidase [Candidatus Blautia faecipullorum]|nr:aminopeptidase [Candidatus Blautia faecipullorum]
MTMEYFLLLLMIVSVMTGLFTEAIKKLLDELQVGYCSNVLAGIVAVILACVVDAGYVIMIDAVLNSKMAVILIALVLLSWLIAMVGYDKVIQAISQFRTYCS